MDVMFGVRNNWPKLIEHQAHPDNDALRRVLRSIPEAYYASVDKPVVVDKCRGWVSLIEMYEFVFEQQAKIIVPVRDLRDVFASFEKLWRKRAEKGQMPGEQENYFQFQTVEGRCTFWAQGTQPVGLAANRIRDAVRRGFSDRMQFVDYDELTHTPTKVLTEIYAFLGEPPYEHDFERIEQVTSEDDTVHGFEDLHKIKPAIVPSEPQWPTVLGSVAEKYENDARFWTTAR